MVPRAEGECPVNEKTSSEGPLRRKSLANWPTSGPDTVYDYGFSVWPDETSPRMRENVAVRALFHHMSMRQVMEFTERQFNDFREELVKVGLTLREIERAPHLEPVGVV